MRYEDESGETLCTVVRDDPADNQSPIRLEGGIEGQTVHYAGPCDPPGGMLDEVVGTRAGSIVRNAIAAARVHGKLEIYDARVPGKHRMVAERCWHRITIESARDAQHGDRA